MIYIYSFVSTILYPFLILLIFFRKINKKEDSTRYKEKILTSSFNVNRNDKDKLIWFHAASIGEVQSIFPIIEKLNSNKNNLKFLITTVTFSSGKLVEKTFNDKKNVSHRYLPLDVAFLVKKFLKLWQPKAIFFVDSEIWPNFIFEIKKNKIPVAIINGRITSKTFRRWMLIPYTARKIFSVFNFILSSNFESKGYLTKLGAQNIFSLGNIKFSNKISLNQIKNKNEYILNNKKIWCAASTHEEEEEFCINTHIRLKNNLPNILTIIIPRHINRSKKIKKICKKLNISAQIINQEDSILNKTEVVIINSFGVMQNYFKYAKSVFIGKSMIQRLKQDGGQNPILAAKLGCKIYHGPYVYNFQEVYQFLKENNISEEIFNDHVLSDKLLEDLKTEKKDFLKSKEMIDDIGNKILKETIDKINFFLKNETV